jgi:hypothetical protein
MYIANIIIVSAGINDTTAIPQLAQLVRPERTTHGDGPWTNA